MGIHSFSTTLIEVFLPSERAVFCSKITVMKQKRQHSVSDMKMEQILNHVCNVKLQALSSPSAVIIITHETSRLLCTVHSTHTPSGSFSTR